MRAVRARLRFPARAQQPQHGAPESALMRRRRVQRHLPDAAATNDPRDARPPDGTQSEEPMDECIDFDMCVG